MRHENTLQTVMAANVAAELYHAQQITRSLSISSKNLRVLAKRIGQNAAGLAVLASFYDECSRETISLADQVSQMTVTTTGAAVKEWRASLFARELERAFDSMTEEQTPAIVKQLLAGSAQREKTNQKRMSHFNRQLHDLLIDMQKNIRSIAVIAVNSKIEAPKTGEHSEVLLGMTQKVEEMIKRILQHIDTALKYLSTHDRGKYT